jgi:hypothetical protein
VIACLGLVALAGCGGTAHTSSTLNVAQAKALAGAINLQAGDMPGYTVTPFQETVADQQGAIGYSTCAGTTPPSQLVVNVHSFDFDRGTGLQVEQLSSRVAVLPSASLVARDFAAVTSPKGESCFVSELTTALGAGSRSLQFGKPVLTKLSPPARGTDGAFGYRLMVPASGGGQRLMLYSDLLGFASGTAQVQLESTRIGQPPDTATEQRLYALLVSRASAQRTGGAAAPAGSGSRPAYR